MLNIINTVKDFSQIYTIRNLILDIQGMINYLDVKDLFYFKNIMRLYQISTIKQILPLIVQKQTQPILNHTKFIYIPAKNIKQCQIGHPIPSNVKQLPYIFQTTIYRVSKHVDYILHKLYFTDNPLLARCKAYEKLQFYLNCTIQFYYFNQKIFDYNDKVQSIFFVLSGQLRLEKQDKKNQNKTQRFTKNIFSQKTKKLLEVGSFAGFQQYLDCSQTRRNALISNSNSTKVLIIKTDVLNRYLEIKYSKFLKQEETQNINLAPSQQNKQLYRQFFSPYLFHPKKIDFSLERQQQKPIVQLADVKKGNNHRNLSSLKFLRKINNFVKENQLSSSNENIKTLIQSKSLILRLKQSTQISKIKLNEQQKENIFMIRKMLQGPKIRLAKKYRRFQLRLSQFQNQNHQQNNLQNSRIKNVKRQEVLSSKLKKRYFKSQKQNSFKI